MIDYANSNYWRHHSTDASTTATDAVNNSTEVAANDNFERADGVEENKDSNVNYKFNWSNLSFVVFL